MNLFPRYLLEVDCSGWGRGGAPDFPQEMKDKTFNLYGFGVKLGCNKNFR